MGFKNYDQTTKTSTPIYSEKNYLVATKVRFHIPLIITGYKISFIKKT